MKGEQDIQTYNLCKQCGKVFLLYRPYHIYCCIECRELVYKRRYRYKKRKRRPKECIQCGESFESNDSKKKYCSPECYEQHKKRFYKPVDAHRVICATCGLEFSTAHHAKIYCSSECFKDARDKRNRERMLR